MPQGKVFVNPDTRKPLINLFTGHCNTSFIYGLNSSIFNCINCYNILIIQDLLLTCRICTRAHTIFLTYLERDERDINELLDPIIIYIVGHEFNTNY